MNKDSKPDKTDQASFLQTAITCYNEAIEHYSFVIDDISSEIYNPVLNASKGPVITFLKEMRQQWVKCREDIQKQFGNL